MNVRDTVLIVEDNELSRKLVRDLLEIKGYRVLEATTGSAGVDLALALRPDLILMDIQLPDFDGVKALARIRAEQTIGSIPVIALTALAMREDRERFIDAGFDGYLSKPIDVDDFLEQVGRYCARREERGSTAENPDRR